MKTCVHCEVAPANGPRLLCKSCYYRPGVRGMYPYKKHACARRGVSRAPSRLPEPTDALPGTDRKIDVLAGRLFRGEYLHHPEDRRPS